MSVIRTLVVFAVATVGVPRASAAQSPGPAFAPLVGLGVGSGAEHPLAAFSGSLGFRTPRWDARLGTTGVVLPAACTDEVSTCGAANGWYSDLTVSRFTRHSLGGAGLYLGLGVGASRGDAWFVAPTVGYAWETPRGLAARVELKHREVFDERYRDRWGSRLRVFTVVTSLGLVDTGGDRRPR